MLAALCFLFQVPVYSSGSIVNAASNLPEALAPNAMATVYGANLSNSTRAIAREDIRGDLLPTVLPGTGVRVLIGHGARPESPVLPSHIYYVSPTQINFLIPASILTGPAMIQVTRDGRAGPVVPVQLQEAAPGLFPINGCWAVATRLDGSLLTPDRPGRPGEVVVLYATGLGPTSPKAVDGRIPQGAARIERLNSFNLLLNGSAVDPRRILYVGLTPGFAGLYQVNAGLPEDAPPNPEVRVAVGEALSQPGLRLPVAGRGE